MDDQRGFTLIEIMVAVAIVAVLALIAIPMFTSESRKGKAKTEVGPMFAEISAKEESYKVDNGAYLTLNTCPTLTHTAPTDATGCLTDTTWAAARIALPNSKLLCKYAVTQGAANTAVTGVPAGFTFNPTTSPSPVSWYWILATCDMNGDGTTSTYFQGSGDGIIQVQNEGQ